MNNREEQMCRFMIKFTECFCGAHFVAAWFMVLLVDVEPNYIRVLICLAYCMAAAMILGLLNIQFKEYYKEHHNEREMA